MSKFTIDDAVLLRAIRIVDGLEEADENSTVRINIINSEHFRVLNDNDHLRALLRTFLEANIQVAQVESDISRTRSQGIIGRVLDREKIKILQDRKKILKDKAEAAFKPYEMLRKLTDSENSLLKRVVNQ